MLKGAYNEVGRKAGIQRTTHCLNVANVTTRPATAPAILMAMEVQSMHNSRYVGTGGRHAPCMVFSASP